MPGAVPEPFLQCGILLRDRLPLGHVREVRLRRPKGLPGRGLGILRNLQFLRERPVLCGGRGSRTGRFLRSRTHQRQRPLAPRGRGVLLLEVRCPRATTKWFWSRGSRASVVGKWSSSSWPRANEPWCTPSSTRSSPNKRKYSSINSRDRIGSAWSCTKGTPPRSISA